MSMEPSCGCLKGCQSVKASGLCSSAQRQRYATRVSGPLLDRFDLQVAVPALDPAELGGPADLEHATARLGDLAVGPRDLVVVIGHRREFRRLRAVQ